MTSQQQRPVRGFTLALIASMTWGALPVAAQQVLKVIDAQTLVWVRFLVAAVGVFAYLALTKKLPKRTAFTPKVLGLIALGILGLSANFFLFAEALHYISPTTNQVLWQLAPFSMMLCGVWLFKEPFGKHQKIGLILLIVGLIAFFNDRFDELFQLNSYALGVLLGAGASLLWVLYGVAQKMLLAHFSSSQILLMLYFGCGILFSPFATPTELADLNGFVLLCFLFCCANTFIGYGAYGEALNHWEASKVGVVTTLLPIFSWCFSHLGHYIAPETFPDQSLNFLSLIGAFVVVFGAILSIIGHQFFNDTKTK